MRALKFFQMLDQSLDIPPKPLAFRAVESSVDNNIHMRSQSFIPLWKRFRKTAESSFSRMFPKKIFLHDRKRTSTTLFAIQCPKAGSTGRASCPRHYRDPHTRRYFHTSRPT